MKRMRVRAFSLGFLLAAMYMSGCGKGGRDEVPATTPGRIVRVGGEILTEKQLETALPNTDRTPFSTEEKAAFVRNWIEIELLYREAIRRGLQNDPGIKTRIRTLEKEFLADHLVFVELQKRVRVTEDEIEEYYRNNQKEYTCEYRVSHILVNTMEEAENARELLKSRSFAWVANKYSVDPVPKRGGDLGYLTKGNMMPEFENVVFGMQPGETSGIVQSGLGYHILYLADAREARVQVSPAEVREQIVSTLLMEKRKKAYGEFFESLMRSADIEFYTKNYEQGTAPEAPGGTGFTAGDTSATPDTLSMEENGEGH